MEGVALTETGESLATLLPMKLLDILVDEPQSWIYEDIRFRLTR
jgi:hypothetical protein